MEIYVDVEVVCAGLSPKNVKGPPEERMPLLGFEEGLTGIIFSWLSSLRAL